MTYAEMTKSIMHLLLAIMIWGVCWILLVELQPGVVVNFKSILAWIIIFFVVPLTVMNFNDEIIWFTGASLVFGLLISFFSLAQLLKISEQVCCKLAGSIILITTLLTCLGIIVICARILLRIRNRGIRS